MLLLSITAQLKSFCSTSWAQPSRCLLLPPWCAEAPDLPHCHLWGHLPMVGLASTQALTCSESHFASSSRQTTSWGGSLSKDVPRIIGNQKVGGISR